MPREPDPLPDFSTRRVLLICTRDPRGRSSGRKMVLRTVLDSLDALGLEVTVGYFGPAEGRDDVMGNRGPHFVRLPGPRLVERLLSGLGWFFKQQASLNEGLYWSRRALKVLEVAVRQKEHDLVITDMLRTARYGARLGRPWIADLDDLLSRRYHILAASYDRHANLLGYYPSAPFRVLLRLGWRAVPWALRREAAIIERREIEVARSANVTTLVSPHEAAALARAADRQVRWTPMAVKGPPEVLPVSGRPRELVFLGGLDYGPNFRSVSQFDKELRPALDALGMADLKLHVIGEPAGARARLSESVVLEGYVEDLEAAMAQYQAMLVPEVQPGGLKTKILVAALNGNLVLAHQSALDGLGLTSGREVWAWGSSADLAELLIRLRHGELDVERTTLAARDWAVRTFGPDALRQMWQRNLLEALASGRPSCVDSGPRAGAASSL